MFISTHFSSRWWELLWEILPPGEWQIVFCLLKSFIKFQEDEDELISRPVSSLTADWSWYSRGPKKKPREEEIKTEGSAPHQAALHKGKRKQSPTLAELILSLIISSTSSSVNAVKEARYSCYLCCQSSFAEFEEGFVFNCEKEQVSLWASFFRQEIN